MFLSRASDRGKAGKSFFVVSALPTSAPQAFKASFRSSRGTLTPFQCHLDVQRCPKPPVQGQLNVRRRPKLPFQCQLDVQRCPKRRFRANLTFKGAQNCPSRGTLTFKGAYTLPEQQSESKLLQMQLNVNATKRSSSMDINGRTLIYTYIRLISLSL